MRRNKKQKAQGRLTGLAALAAGLCLAGGLSYAAYVYTGYAKGRTGYGRLEAEYTADEPVNKSPPLLPTGEGAIDGSGENTGNGNGDANEGTGEDGPDKKAGGDMRGKHIWEPLVAELPADAPSKKRIDWDALLEKSGDVVGWITIPAVEISYPVMQAEDNAYYLHRDIDGEYLFAGSVFMDALNDSGLYNYNTIIYGHNMRDGSMFARLKEFQNRETLERGRYFWIQTPGADCLYRIFSVHYADAVSATFTLRFADLEEYELWQNTMLGLSAVPSDEKLSMDDRIVTLSTCTESSAVRMTVQGKLVWRREQGSPEETGSLTWRRGQGSREEPEN